MRVFVVGASGAIGTPARAAADDRGHEVIGTSRSAGQRRAGARARRRADRARPARRHARARGGRRRRARRDRPPGDRAGRRALLPQPRPHFAPTNRLRTEGTDALLAAAREAGVHRFVAQSFASYRYAREGGPVKTEDDPLDPTRRPAARETNAAMTPPRRGGHRRRRDRAALRRLLRRCQRRAGRAVRKRQFPIVGDGGGVILVHPPGRRRRGDRARARATRPGHLQRRRRRARPGARVAAGARRARSAPSRRATSRSWLARLFAGDGLAMMTESRGASNAKAKRELGWTLRHPSWRQGFPASNTGPDLRPDTHQGVTAPEKNRPGCLR